MQKKHPITVAYGDGIGPEIMEATLNILKEGGAQVHIEKVEIGEKMYKAGHVTGMDDSVWDSIRKTKVFLKAPITTPQGGGYRSLNVTIRTKLGLFANVRPCTSYYPFVETKHPVMDVIIVRENEEDLYTGIEYRQTTDVRHAIKLISRPGSERILRYAFEYAQRYRRKKVTCFTKDNILKMCDGLFHQIFEEIGEEYPQIEKEHWIIDIGAAKLADTPENFDVVVLQNLYGDILSDVAAQISGSVGLAGSANIGEHGAMFEAIHGSAPRRAGQNVANPSGLILASILMLIHIHQNEAATHIHNAWLKTIEDGIHTYDIYKKGVSKECVGTSEFAQAVIDRLGKKPQQLTPANYALTDNVESRPHSGSKAVAEVRKLVGVDIFIHAYDALDAILQKLQGAEISPFKVDLISNRGVKVWPGGIAETLCVDQWRCRFLAVAKEVNSLHIAKLLVNLHDKGIDVIKTENLYTFNDVAGYS